jgi:predicted ATPase
VGGRTSSSALLRLQCHPREKRTSGERPNLVPDTPQPATKRTAAEAATPGRATSPEDNLPVRLSGLVGREREIAEVERLLADNRLLTLTGPGGSGKTRLALAVAHEVVRSYEEGAWFVELAPLSDPDLVPQALASVLSVREAPGRSLTEALADHLLPRRTLLVLDNCEHLVGACASLAQALLSRCPNLEILATSREVLGVEGEALFVVPPLSLPDPRRLTAADGLLEYEAARLFVERARAVRPHFELTERNAAATARICHRLDGMPLAIELAAARARALSAEQIASRLEAIFALLAGPGRRAAPAHQATLRATMDWSFDLLGEGERALLRRLSVFSGASRWMRPRGCALGMASQGKRFWSRSLLWWTSLW